MQPLFSIQNILPADFFHVWSAGKYGQKITRVIGSVGTHDGLFLNGHTVGESTVKPPWSHQTDLEHYENKMRAGKCMVSILRIPGISMFERYSIASAWFKHVEGTAYDFRAIWQMYTSRSKVWLKDSALDLLPDDTPVRQKALGWKWAHWCTEGLNTACLKGSYGEINPLANKNPTPRTVENRVRDGRLIDVSKDCLTLDGQKYRLIIPEEAV